MDDSMMFQRLISSLGGAGGWHYAVYIAGMFAALLWRRESIVNWGLFRASYLLFAAGLVLPAVVQPVLMSAMVSGGLRSGGMSVADANILLNVIWAALGPGLFAGAVICGLGSMMPRPTHSLPLPTPQQQQQQHPLD